MKLAQLTFGVHYTCNIVTFTHILTKPLLTAAGRKQNITSQSHQADNSMFRKVLHNSEHVLYSLLPLFLTPSTISENVHMTEYCLIVFLI